jgi:hypothetical protein
LIRKELPLMTASELASAIVRMPVQQALNLAREHGIETRISSLDGEARMLTSNYRPERLNLNVEKDIVLSVRTG